MENEKEILILPSYYQIGDEVAYIAFDYNERINDSTEKKEMSGVVTRVIFTKAKVRYTILDDATGYTFDVISDDIIYPEELVA